MCRPHRCSRMSIRPPHSPIGTLAVPNASRQEQLRWSGEINTCRHYSMKTPLLSSIFARTRSEMSYIKLGGRRSDRSSAFHSSIVPSKNLTKSKPLLLSLNISNVAFPLHNALLTHQCAVAPSERGFSRQRGMPPVPSARLDPLQMIENPEPSSNNAYSHCSISLRHRN